MGLFLYPKELMQLRLAVIITMLIALALPLKAKAMQAEDAVRHWKVERVEHVHAKHYVRTHPARYTYKKWTYLLRHHTKAIVFATHMIQKWQYKTVPPHKAAWDCIHRYEGSWSDDGDPYWGGLQMDRGFMKSYAPAFLLRRGWANHWSPREQMWVAENALAAGRGFWPWPNTARECGYL